MRRPRWSNSYPSPATVDPKTRRTAAPVFASSTVAAEVSRQFLSHLNDDTCMGESIECHRLEVQLETVAATTARLAHDFGNILTGILGFAELAMAKVPPQSAASEH